ncbi:hypothetical protein M427DRAFT_132455 [Gonapodya prolifera JEL478]|uniref:Uncharacterized protein n=1 Tax=Gonapodya prolifera (strain JEL478) TaxID=1344416 RepID=A0A139AQB9_GONPJ|nr:hypothetical protein M427DRAFT_132455 [Gonapodya prolifera JEL478]|eukprot:KXS18961.1 hypothetical protein M427DRAFT_132455 [Gonapodya prolifera JEL478]
MPLRIAPPPTRTISVSANGRRMQTGDGTALPFDSPTVSDLPMPRSTPARGMSSPVLATARLSAKLPQPPPPQSSTRTDFPPPQSRPTTRVREAAFRFALAASEAAEKPATADELAKGKRWIVTWNGTAGETGAGSGLSSLVRMTINKSGIHFSRIQKTPSLLQTHPLQSIVSCAPEHSAKILLVCALDITTGHRSEYRLQSEDVGSVTVGDVAA